VAPRDLGDAMAGDRVVGRVTRRGRAGRLQGVLTGTLSRRSRRVLGVYMQQGKLGKVQPFDPSLGEPLHVPAAFRSEAVDRQVVEVEILRQPDPNRPAQAKILDVLGGLDDPGTDVMIVARKYGLAMELPEPVLKAAAKLPSRIGSTEKAGRERFDDPAPVTIDGETAADFDDAVAVSRLPHGGFRLFVHIADVSHFVPPGSVLDAEARRRGTSVYFPGKVLPMFPEKLSNDLCSLRPGVDRLVQTAIIDFDRDGERRKIRFADGVIRSAARLTYPQAAQVLNGEKRVRGVPAGVVPMLGLAGELATALRGQRSRRGSVDFDLPEPTILLDVEGVMTGITVEPRNVAHLLIEEFMLAANEAVAGWLEQREAKCMFRVHARPDPLKLEALSDFVRGFGYDELPGDVEAIDSQAIRQMLEWAEGRPESTVISQVTLRSMSQARYSMANDGHFGLAAVTYCHFTSPIRRYPDLVVHRLLRERRAGRGKAEGQGIDLDGVAEGSSELERNAEAAERELLAWKKVAFIEGSQGEEFQGVVTGAIRVHRVAFRVAWQPIEYGVPAGRPHARAYRPGRPDPAPGRPFAGRPPGRRRERRLPACPALGEAALGGRLVGARRPIPPGGPPPPPPQAMNSGLPGGPATGQVARCWCRMGQRRSIR